MEIVKSCIQPINNYPQSYVYLRDRQAFIYSCSYDPPQPVQTVISAPLPLIPLQSQPLNLPHNAVSNLPFKLWRKRDERSTLTSQRSFIRAFFALYVTRRKSRLEDEQSAHELDDSGDLSSPFQSAVGIGDHSFTHMEDDIDRQRLLGGQPSYTKTDEETASMTTDLQKKERYERLLRRAKTEDLNEVSGIGCLYQCGVDKLGRPVIVFIGKWFKFNEINLDKALLHLINLLEPLVQGDYVIIYFHTITTAVNHPSLSWIRQVYDVLQYKHKKHLKSFYIIHPTFWTKIMTWWFTTFMAPQIKHKVHSLPGVEYLYDVIDPDQLEIPAYIIEHDMTINGIRYYKQGTS